METSRCAHCNGPMNLPRKGARFCTSKCRVYAFREAKRRPEFPSEMTSRARWVRRAADKRPLTISGHAASSTDPRTWVSFEAASAATAGAGLGYVLGAGIGCWDFDHCLFGGVLTDWAREAIEAISDPLLIEISQSGEGVHIFVEAAEGPGWKIRDGRNIEFYSAGRYIAVTGQRLSM